MIASVIRVTARLPQRSVIAVLLVTALGTAWGLQYASAKIIGDAGLPPLGSLFTVHVLLSVAFIALLSLRCELFIPTRGELGFFCLAGFLGNILSLAVELIAAVHLPVEVLTLVLAMAPVCTIAIARIFGTESICPRQSFGLVVGAAAAGSILMPQAGLEEAPAKWVLMAFIAPLGFGFYTVLLAARWPRRLNTAQVATGIAVAATIMLAPLASLEGEPFLIGGRFGTSDLALVAFAITMGAGYYLLTLISRHCGAIFASCANFIAVATGLFWNFALFGEVPTGWVGLAACLCVAAVFMVKRRPTALTLRA